MAGVWARGTSNKNLGPLLISATVEASNFKFGTQIGFGTSLSKTTFKLATSNLVYYLGLGVSYQKITFRTKIGGGGLREHPKKIWDPL